MKRVVAAFDFDGTLTKRDTLLPFLLHVLGVLPFCLKLIRFFPRLIMLLTFKGRSKAKEALIEFLLSGISENRLRSHANTFATEKLCDLERSEAVDRLKWHQERGDYCVVVSASVDLYLEPWCSRHKLDALLCTEFDPRAKCFLSLNCRGQEKVRRLDELLPDRESYILYAYGDSSGDTEMLNFADYPFYQGKELIS